MKQLRLRFRLITFSVIALLVAAGVYGLYSVNAYGSRWVSSSRNSRYRNAKSSVTAGDIQDRNGITLASTDENGKRVYQSDLLSRSALVHLLGDTEGNVANGVESFQADYLLGFQTSFTERVKALLSGETHKGDTIVLTADSRLQTQIVKIWMQNEATRGKSGAVVVMNYKSGEVLALVSLPVYDPENISDEVRASSQHPFWNRATQSTLPPGSTFKIITAAAALEYLPNAKTMRFTCTGETAVEGGTVHDYNKDMHGSITLEDAFRVSCNNTFAQAALMMGDSALCKTAQNFGFNDNFLFRDLVVENSVYPTQNRTAFEIAWSGVGQSRVTVTPMHLCMIASAIANDGVMMEPRLISRVVSPAGVTRSRGASRVYRTACSADTAQTIAKYMKLVTQSGTGSRAKVSGVSVCGKTCSAETSLDDRYVTHAWYTGYIADSRAPYAISVLVEEGESGGTVAAPIAGEVFAYLCEGL